MPEWKQWLLTSVAAEFVRKGLVGADVYCIAEAEGISKEILDTRFHGKKELVLSVISEIAEAHKRYILKNVKNKQTARARLVNFIVAGLEFAEQNPVLSQVIIQGLFSTETEIRDHVYEVYENIFRQMLHDLEEDRIILQRTNALLSDLTTILLSVIFTGGCPQIIMEYFSGVDLYRLANSLLDALQRHYQSNIVGSE